MGELILTDEQLASLAFNGNRISVRDSRGNLVGFLEPPLLEEEIEELKRTYSPAREPAYTSKQIQARLRAFEEEWQRTGGFNKAYLDEFRRKLDLVDPRRIHFGNDAE